MKFNLAVIFTVFLSFLSYGQTNDSLLLSFKELGKEDIRAEDNSKTQNILSGSRTLKEVTDLPYTIYVITKEQIQEFGYVTLVDVLKSVPGIRVSQPGSGLDGETFLMRGLLGNQYTKILINDIPIRPSAARSMPIGAQLPIQQAERIEIIFGPTPGIYGADAMAGVINIITADTERPFYVQSDVSLGNLGFKRLNVSLGGKLGRDKNVVKFNIFGSYTEMGNLPIVFDRDTLYNPSFYLDNTNLLSQIPNYIGTPENPVIRTFPHNSESIGARLKYRDFYLHFEQMNRQDHSALGLNPVSVSLANSLNFTGENINRINGGWATDLDRWSFRIDATNLRYELNARTSNNYILSTPNRGTSFWQDKILFAPFDTIDFNARTADIYARYLSFQRFSFARSVDWYLDPMLTFKMNKKWDITLGANILYSENQPFVNYSPIPFNDKTNQQRLEQQLGRRSFALIPQAETFNNIGLYGQLYYHLDNLSLLGVFRYDIHSQFGENYNSSISALYRLGDDLSARISFRNASQTPSSYFYANSLNVKIDTDSTWVTFANPTLEREHNKSFEIGLRWGRSNSFDTDITYFRTENTGLLSYGIFPEVGEDLNYIATYFNDPASFMIIRGWQGRLSLGLFDGTDGYFNFQFTRGEEQLPLEGGQLDQIRGQGKWTWQGRFSTKLSSRWFLQSVHTFSQAWVSRNLMNVKDLEDSNRYNIPKYYNLDVTLRYQLSEEFQGFAQVFNVFNKQYAGIAVGTFDTALLYNPQSLRTFRVGLNYRMR
ncbi:MAG: TonB-dependent receptor plug domain-containing protein [Bacteroidota bacterium]